MTEFNILSLSEAKCLRLNYITGVIELINADLMKALEENKDIFEYKLTQPGLAEYLSLQYTQEGYSVHVVPPCTERNDYWLTFNLNQLNP